MTVTPLFYNINFSQTNNPMVKGLPFKTFRPLLNRILVAKPEATNVTKGGIILKKEEDVSWGTVVAVGPGRRDEEGKHIPVTVKVGDQVLLPAYGGTTVTLADQKELNIYRDDEIVGLLEDKEIV